jgi:hypothetical protein
MVKVHEVIKQNHTSYAADGNARKKYAAFFLTHREMLDFTIMTFPD